MTNFTEDNVDNICFSYVEEEGCELRIFYQCKHVLRYHRKDVYSTIERGRNSVDWEFFLGSELGEIILPLNIVRQLLRDSWYPYGYEVSYQYHDIYSAGTWMGAHVVVEVVEGSHSVFGWIFLLRA